MKSWHAYVLLALAAAAVLLLRCGAGRTVASAATNTGDRGIHAVTAEPSPPSQPEELRRAGVEAETGGAAALDPDLELRGIVVDSLGAPIAAAELSALRQISRQSRGPSALSLGLVERLAAETHSDQAGKFSLRLQAHRIYDLTASKAGFGTLRVCNLYAGEEQRIVLTRAASISGRITDTADGSPLTGVVVRLKQHSSPEPYLVQESQASGEYAFLDLPSGEFELDFQSLTHVRRYGVQVRLRESEQAHEDVTLSRGAAIFGRVTDGTTHEPLAGAEVRIRAAVLSVRTDSEGRYRLESVPPNFHDALQLRAPGYGEFDFPIQFIPPEGLEQDFGLLRGRTAHGRLVDRSGTPVPDAEVVAEAHTSRSQYGSWQVDRQLATSRDDGEFLLADLRVDLRHSLLIHAEGLATMVYDFPAAEWDSTDLELGDLILEPECRIAGVVEDPHGALLEGLWVSISGEAWRRDALGPAAAEGKGYMNQAGFGFGDVYVRTDARGRFALSGLAAGSYHLWAGKKGFATGAESAIELLYEGESITDLKLVLDPGFSISGIVTDDAGHPVLGATVSVAPESDPGRRLTYAIAGSDGDFRIAGLEIGSYCVSADAGFNESNASGWTGRKLGRIDLHEVAAGRTDLQITLPSAASVSGVVLGPDESPVPGAVLFFWIPGESHGEGLATSGSDGRFEFWLNQGQSGSLHVNPPMLVLPGQPMDRSLEVVIPDVRAGDSGLVVRLPRLR